MDLFHLTFPISGDTTNVLLPPFISIVISFFTSMGGISGAFLLLPFQMSVLNYTAPSVSGTNHVFNIIAIPSGVYRYIKEGRMAWPLTWVVIVGTLPGVFIGYYLRGLYLPGPRVFKMSPSRLSSGSSAGPMASAEEPSSRPFAWPFSISRYTPLPVPP